MSGFLLTTETDADVTINLVEGTASSDDIGVDSLEGIEDIEGAEGNDTLTGDEGENYIIGAAGNDTLSGRGGNDQLEGGQGNDILDGGEGNDEALFSGKQEDYEITVDQVNDIVTVSDSRDYYDGKDTLSNVEKLIFSDSSVDVLPLLNAAPNDISISANLIQENVAAGSTVARITSTDVDPGDSFTYSLVNGDGDSDNASFSISGDQLLINDSPDFETKSSYSIRLQTSDQHGLSFEKQFSISVQDSDEIPLTDIEHVFDNNAEVDLNSQKLEDILKAIGTFPGEAIQAFITRFQPQTDNTSPPPVITPSLPGSKIRLGSVKINPSDEERQTVEIPVDIVMVDSSVSKIKLASLQFAYDANLLDFVDDGHPVEVTSLETKNQIATILQSEKTGWVIDPPQKAIGDDGSKFTFMVGSVREDEDKGLIRICGFDPNLFRGGLEASSASINEENPLRIGTLILKVPQTESGRSYEIKLLNGDNEYVITDQNFNNIEILEAENALIMVNSHPSAISLNTNIFTENIPARSTVATLTSTDPDLDETFTYSLIRGEGDKDNAAFSISGDQLLIKASPDFEAKESYRIRLQTTDSGGLTHEQSHTLSVRDLNERPSALSISSDGISENIAAGSTVTTLISTDPDFDDSYSYSLVNGDGDADNAAFSISDNQLLIRSSPDYETKDRYNIRLQTKDSGDLIIDQAFTLNVKDINEYPSTIVLDTSDIQENIPSGSTVGTLNTIDPDTDESFTYSLINGDNDTDNPTFSISGDQISIKAAPDFEVKKGYTIRVQSTDAGGLTIEKPISINVTGINEPPSSLGISTTSIEENIPSNSIIATLSTVDPDANEAFTYSLINGNNDTDNNLFSIKANQLLINESPTLKPKRPTTTSAY